MKRRLQRTPAMERHFIQVAMHEAISKYSTLLADRINPRYLNCSVLGRPLLLTAIVPASLGIGHRKFVTRRTLFLTLPAKSSGTRGFRRA